MPIADISDLIRSAPRNCWLALNDDQSALIAYGDTVDAAIDAARAKGVEEPVLLWSAEEWIPAVYWGLRLRKSYIAVPIDKPNPITGESKYWVPYLRVRLAKGHTVARAPIFAVVDSGSPFCLFRADLGAAIGLKDISTGIPFEIGGVKKGVKDTAYFHRISLYIEADWKIEVVAGFSANLSVGGLLGRNGFFDNFYVTFDHSGNPPALEVKRIDRIN